LSLGRSPTRKLSEERMESRAVDTDSRCALVSGVFAVGGGIRHVLDFPLNRLWGTRRAAYLPAVGWLGERGSSSKRVRKVDASIRWCVGKMSRAAVRASEAA
jgi:hypothetical protein